MTKILLLEDSETEALLAKHTLQQSGCAADDILHVKTLSDARQKIGGCDKCVADLILPDATVCDAIPWIVTEVQIPTVVVSGANLTPRQLGALLVSSHVIGFIDKNGIQRLPELLSRENRDANEWVQQVGQLLC